MSNESETRTTRHEQTSTPVEKTSPTQEEPIPPPGSAAIIQEEVTQEKEPAPQAQPASTQD